MNLKNLKNEVLVQNTKNLVREENRILSKVQAHLFEIEARKLYLELGYGSLFQFAVKELGYSDASAMRRIEAMRFLKKTPEATAIVDKGQLNLSRLSLLERLSKESNATHEKNVEALHLAQEQSNAAAESTLREHFNLKKRKRIITIEVDEETYQLWQDTKARLREPKDSEALKKLCMIPESPKKEQTKVRQSPATRAAGIVLRRELLKRAGHRCEFMSEITGRRCDSTQFLECDHKIPHFLCGETSQQNMRVLCAQHNKLMFRQLQEAGVT